MRFTTLIRNFTAATFIAAIVATAGAVSFVPNASALDCGTKEAQGPDYNKPACKVNDGVVKSGGAGQTSLGDQIKAVINVLLFIIGVVSVIMIILGGIKYVLSNGDSSQITSAKNTILYAVIGLIVALLAYAIVNFVVAQFAK